MTEVDDVTVAQIGRERQTKTLRSKLYWSLVAMSMIVAAPALVLAESGAAVLAILGSLIVAAVVAIWVNDHLMAPVYALRQRLELKNYGEHEMPAGDEATPQDSEFHLDAWIFTSPDRRVDLLAGLPVELAAIERLAKAGRVSEIAMESVKRDLFRHLSHQLKSPLALMRAHAQTAAHALDSFDRGTIEASLHSIEAINMNTSGLVETMLSLAWVEGLEEQGMGRQATNLSHALMEMAGLRKRAAAERQMRIETHVQAGLWVRGERQLLQEMFSCLLDNALRYGPSSSVVKLDAQRLPGSKTVIVTVTDIGPGIPPQERDRVFEPFYGSIGLDASGKMTYGTRRQRALGAGVDRSSHGLGLSLVRAVAKLHGASVTLDSGPDGSGLHVRVVLSAAAPPGDEAAEIPG